MRTTGNEFGLERAYSQTPGLRKTKIYAFAVLTAAAFSIFVGFLADSFRPIAANDSSFQFAVMSGTGSLSITSSDAAPCTNFDMVNNRLDLNVNAGYIAADCVTVSVSTDSINGYSLTINGPADGALRQGTQTIDAKDGNMTAPTVFAAQTTGGAWGFGIPNDQIHGHDWGFDDAYQAFGATNAINTALYAPVPSTATIFSSTDGPNTSDDDYNIFFAVAAGTTMPSGEYTGLVTVSAMMNSAAPPYDCANVAAGFATGCTDNNVAVTLPSNAVSGGMVPVKYTGDETTPQWTVVSPSDSTWYNYAGKQWANAVTFQTAGIPLTSAGHST
jgi:hypothetical protein